MRVPPGALRYAGLCRMLTSHMHALLCSRRAQGLTGCVLGAGTNERYALPVGEDGEEPDADGQQMSLSEEEQDLVTRRFLEYLQAQVCTPEGASGMHA